MAPSQGVNLLVGFRVLIPFCVFVIFAYICTKPLQCRKDGGGGSCSGKIWLNYSFFLFSLTSRPSICNRKGCKAECMNELRSAVNKSVFLFINNTMTWQAFFLPLGPFCSGAFARTVTHTTITVMKELSLKSCLSATQQRRSIILFLL